MVTSYDKKGYILPQCASLFVLEEFKQRMSFAAIHIYFTKQLKLITVFIYKFFDLWFCPGFLQGKEKKKYGNYKYISLLSLTVQSFLKPLTNYASYIKDNACNLMKSGHFFFFFKQLEK